MKKHKPSILALIPARAGSKGIPGKNLIDLNGKPLIAWTIEAITRANAVDRIMVSTEDACIAAVARQWGAEVPFLRDHSLAQDTTSSMEVVQDTITQLFDLEQYRADYLMLLQPTSPLRTEFDIISAIQLLEQDPSAEGVVSIVDKHSHPLWSFTLDSDKRLTSWLSKTSEAKPFRRQEIPPVYYPNGAIYLAKTSSLLAQGDWYAGKVLGYEMPPHRSIDIDTPWDLNLARLILEDAILENNKIEHQGI